MLPVANDVRLGMRPLWCSPPGPPPPAVYSASEPIVHMFIKNGGSVFLFPIGKISSFQISGYILVSSGETKNTIFGVFLYLDQICMCASLRSNIRSNTGPVTGLVYRI